MSGWLGELGFLPEQGHFFPKLLIRHKQFANESLETFVLRLHCL
jgi:hypothetical protein